MQSRPDQSLAPLTGSAEVRYRLLVEQIPAITYIADFEGARPFLYVSPQAEELLGYPAEDWIADTKFWDAILHPEDRERVLAEERRTLAAKQTFEAEYRLIARDGRVVWIWERDQLVRDESGEIVCTQGVLMDITDAKTSAMALSESEDLLRDERDRAQRYLDIAATMIVVLGTDGADTLVNKRACDVLGYAEEELVGLQEGRGAADRLAQHAAARRGRAGDRRAELGRGHHRAPQGPGASGLPRLPRPAHRLAQPRDARRPPDGRRGAGEAHSHVGRAAVPRRR